MKKLINILLWLSAFLVPCAGQVTKISQEPVATFMVAGDDILINVSNTGAGTWTTKRINLGNLLASSGMTNVLTSVALHNFASNALVALLAGTNDNRVMNWTNWANFIRGNFDYRTFNVRDYGAVGDGVTDDSLAISNAIRDWTNNTGDLYFPNGFYLDHNAHLLSAAGAMGGYGVRHFPARIKGDGSGNSVWAYIGTNNTLLGITNFGMGMESMALVNEGVGTNSGFATHGICLGGYISDVEVDGFPNYGMLLQASSFTKVYGCVFQSNNVGLRIAAYSDGSTGDIRINKNTVGLEIGGAEVEVPNQTIYNTKWYISGAGNGIACIIGASHGVQLSGAMESSTNCCVALGYPPGFNETNFLEYSINLQDFNFLDNGPSTNVFARVYQSPPLLIERNVVCGRTNVAFTGTGSEQNFAAVMEGVGCTGASVLWSDGTTIAGGVPIYYQTVNLPETRYYHTNGTASFAYFNSPNFDPDAETFFNILAANSNYLSAGVKQAVQNLVVAMKTDGTWQLADCIYPLVGGSSNSCSWNLVNPSQYRIAWHGTETFNTNGVTSDGSTGYGDTTFNPVSATSPNYTQNSASMFLYSGTTTPTTTGTSYFMGSEQDAAPAPRAGLVAGSSTTLALDGLNGAVSAGNITSVNLQNAMGATRTSSTAETIFAGSLTSNPTQTSSAVPNFNIFICGGRDGNGALDHPLAYRCAFTYIGGGLSATQGTSLINDILAFETALNRL